MTSPVSWLRIGVGILAFGLVLSCSSAPSLTPTPVPSANTPASTRAATGILPGPPPTQVEAMTSRATPAAAVNPSVPFTGTLLIADAGNNRLIEVTVDKQIVWSFPVSGSLPITRTFYYPDDAFFSPDARYISINEEPNEVVSVVDYASRKLVWQFGQPGVAASDLHHFHTPDDAHMLADRSVVVADIRNCRIMMISWDQREIREFGSPGDCTGDPGSFAEPNGVTPLPNGHLLITEIRTRRVSEMDSTGKIIRSVVLPVSYPSDAFLTPRDTIIVADYHTPSRIIEADWSGKVVWTFPPPGSKERLDRSSIAFELPNDHVVISDDYRHRVIVVDRGGQVLWQYGVTDTPGNGPGYLYLPDGMDWHH